MNYLLIYLLLRHKAAKQNQSINVCVTMRHSCGWMNTTEHITILTIFLWIFIYYWRIKMFAACLVCSGGRKDMLSEHLWKCSKLSQRRSPAVAWKCLTVHCRLFLLTIENVNFCRKIFGFWEHNMSVIVLTALSSVF